MPATLPGQSRVRIGGGFMRGVAAFLAVEVDRRILRVVGRPLVGAGLLYLGYVLVSGEWRKLIFRPRDVRPAIGMAKYYLRLAPDHPPQGKHNALQRNAYTAIVALGALSVLTGLAIWKPIQFKWLTALFGGYQAARYWHFWIVWAFVAFTLTHVILVFTADPGSFRAMITGRYRGKYTDDEP